jgi:acid phosphatase
VHFFSLSSEHPLEIGSVQHDWLLAELAAAEAEPGYRFTILYLHRPIYSYGDYGPRADQVMAIEPVVRDHRIPLVLAGHMHGYERFEIDYPSAAGLGRATYVTTGAGGFSGTMASVNEGLPDDPALAALRVASGAFFQAMQVEITSGPDGDVLTAVALDDVGAVRDSFDVLVPPR